MSHEELQREIDRLDAGGDAWADTDGVEVDINAPLKVVVELRLPSDIWGELPKEARKRGVGPSTLVAVWIGEKLRDGAGASPV